MSRQISVGSSLTCDGTRARSSGSGKSSVKIEPTSGVDWARMVPPISSVKDFVIASPSPVPPNRRVVELSACEKRSNNFWLCVSSKPMPVSSTSITKPGPIERADAVTLTRPTDVNFTAFDIRLVMTWRRRTGSPRKSCFVGRVLSNTRSSFFCAQAPAIKATTS